jgi:hypothetical protein
MEAVVLHALAWCPRSSALVYTTRSRLLADEDATEHGLSPAQWLAKIVEVRLRTAGKLDG